MTCEYCFQRKKLVEKMNKIIMGSSRENAGKTSLLLGISHILGSNETGYMKPFGDRLLYRKKRLWDYDSALMANLLEISSQPENITLAFDHSKLRYMYDEENLAEKLQEMAQNVSEGRKRLIIEGGKDLHYGASVGLDTFSLSKKMGAGLVIVVSGENEDIMDDIEFIEKYIDGGKTDFRGFIINKVKDAGEFEETYKPMLEEKGTKILGVVKNEPELKTLSLERISEALFAKVLACENHLDKVIRNIFVGAMSVNSAMGTSNWSKGSKLIITGGDRSDMILASLDGEVSGIILTNNIVPPPNIISKARQKEVPLLLVAGDTYATAKQIDALEPLFTRHDEKKLKLITKMVEESVDLSPFNDG